ncbi:MAG: transcription-repair coupling factor [Paludibacteraceae bacterium]
MDITELRALFGHHPEIGTIDKELAKGGERHLLLSGLHASARSLLLAEIGGDSLQDGLGAAPEDGMNFRPHLHDAPRPLPSMSIGHRFTPKGRGSCRVLAYIADNGDEAQYVYADLKQLLPINRDKFAAESSVPINRDKLGVYYFPTAHRRRQGVDEALAIQRTETLARLCPPIDWDKQAEGNYIIVTYPEALLEETPAPVTLAAQTITFRVGQTVQISRVGQQLSDLGFQRVDFVYEPGQYAIRGGIVDIYSYSHDDPYRLDFFGDEIDSIREFDIESQLSKEKVKEAQCAMMQSEAAEQGSLFDYLPEDTVFASNDFSMVEYKLSGGKFQVSGFNFQSTQTAGETPASPVFSHSRTLEFAEKSHYPTHVRIAFDTLPQPVFHKQFDLLTDDLRQRIDAGYHVYILSEQQKQTDRLAAIFESISGEATPNAQHNGAAWRPHLLEASTPPISFVPVRGVLHEGFVDNGMKICCYTDHQIFERFHRVALTSENARRGKAIITLKEINQLQVGDYVVHSDHGIAKFGGLVSTTVNGKPQEMIKLVYKDNAAVFVSIHNLHRISKYKGKEGTEPTISRLGSGAWERLKERTKERVKDIARDLIKLYATRKQQQGFAYTPDGYMQHELEASFLYEDTPDQAKTTADVKRDMESPMPMDRLVCGDVGFGKTEVAMRAAFKAATDGKQVAVLVPTTVLALQHYNTFRERMKDFPVRIEYLSRAKSAKEVKEILQALEEGKIDILIGTHKLVGKSVKWHDLGLLIIDEEQKFGVAVKEKLKTLRTNVDVLTLTATPIPRTLQFSLLGARDLSVMTTPPQNRYPVQTELITQADEDIIKEAITLEMQRNGQIFIVNNRIEMLPRIERKIRALCPEARIITAHGQMPSEEMEKRLEDFINYDYDILLATTIIESGVDIPNVNTMIIYSAHQYGLSDLHQLRGRVGRSNRKAYCYLVTPDRELLTADARRRLEALSTFADLGAGFQLAMQDLDIRGAGNLLGSEQSGFIADLGYETYQRILNEAVEELREEEGCALTLPAREEPQTWASDSQLESDLPLGFPTDYVENISERITLYRELDGLRNEDRLLDFKKRLIDRFGPLPEQADELLNVVRLRWLCCRMGIEKVMLKQQRLVLYFVQNKDAYWQSDIFGKMIQFVMNRAQRCRLVEETDKKGQKTGRRYAVIQNVQSVAGAIHLLSKIEKDG